VAAPTAADSKSQQPSSAEDIDKSVDDILTRMQDALKSPRTATPSIQPEESQQAALQAFPQIPFKIGGVPHASSKQLWGAGTIQPGLDSSSSSTNVPSSSQDHAGKDNAKASVPDANSDGAQEKKQGPRLKLLPVDKLLGLTEQPAQQRQQQQKQQKQQPQEGKPPRRPRTRRDARPALQTPTAEENKKTEESDQKLAAPKILPREPLHISPPPAAIAVTAVDTSRALLQVPSSFMGISHEWNHVEAMNTAPGYKAALKLLSSYGTGPFIIRVGGGSTDSTKELLSYGTYSALREVYRETGARFILGLNFADADLRLTQAQVLRAQRNLPENALVAFELGNEVSSEE
jgi:hypothetical protein